MRLLFVIPAVNYGGLAKMFLCVAENMARRKHEVTILTFREKWLENDNSIFHYVHLPLETTGGHIFNIFRSSIALRRYIQKKKFQAIIAFSSAAQVRLVLGSWGSTSKLIFSNRGDPYFKEEGLYRHLQKILSHWIFCRANAYVFQTLKVMKYYPTRVQKRGTIIANPVTIPGIINKRTNVQKRIVSVGRLYNLHKRQDLLIDAFKMIADRYQDYWLEFYGDGPDEDMLRDRANPCSRIIFMGKTESISEKIKDASIFILTSDLEGIPNALIEAMALGLPCISTDFASGGAKLLIRDGVDGLLTSCGDVIALVRKMEQLLSNHEYAEQLGTNARDVVERFSEEKIINQWEEFLQKTV